MSKVIVILGGGLKRGFDDVWHTTEFDDKGDLLGVTGDRLRVEAGICLFKENVDVMFIVSGGRGQYKNMRDVPTIASVIKNELIQLGVPVDKIITEDKSGSTWQQLQELKKIFKNQTIDDLCIITNEYHVSRLRLMVYNDSEFMKIVKHSKFMILSAEKILLKHDNKKWRKIIQAGYSSLAMKKRIKLEKKGIQDIKLGTYKYE